MPSGVHLTSGSSTGLGVSFVEHSHALQAKTAGVYDTSFVWTAPVAGTGTVTMYCTINAVNGNGNADNTDVSSNTNVQLTEVSSAGVNNVFDNMSLVAYPNPVVNTLHLQMNGATEGIYNVAVFDLTGKMIAKEDANVNSSNFDMTINTGNWSNGIYFVQVAKDGALKTLKVIK
jgi:hypothetical protein